MGQAGNKLISYIGGFFRRRNFIDSQLKRIEKFDVHEVLGDSLAKITFRKYLGKKHEYGTRIVLILWESYNMCDRIQGKTLELNEIIIKKLSRACPSYTEEGQLISHLKIYKIRNDEPRMNYVLDQIKLIICEKIKESYAYKMFMNDIKIKKKSIRKIVGEIHESLEDLKDDLDDFLINLMGNSINI